MEKERQNALEMAEKKKKEIEKSTKA